MLRTCLGKENRTEQNKRKKFDLKRRRNESKI
jgi:hypothetical protein